MFWIVAKFLLIVANVLSVILTLTLVYCYLIKPFVDGTEGDDQ